MAERARRLSELHESGEFEVAAGVGEEPSGVGVVLFGGPAMGRLQAAVERLFADDFGRRILPFDSESES